MVRHPWKQVPCQPSINLSRNCTLLKNNSKLTKVLFLFRTVFDLFPKLIMPVAKQSATLKTKVFLLVLLVFKLITYEKGYKLNGKDGSFRLSIFILFLYKKISYR